MKNIVLMDAYHSVASATAVATGTTEVIQTLSKHRNEHIDELIIGHRLNPEALEVAVNTLTAPSETGHGLGFDIGVVYVDRDEPAASEIVSRFKRAGIVAESATISDI